MRPKINSRDIERFASMQAFEIKAREAGYGLIAGIDEAGRGPLAGPVVAAAVILNQDQPIYGLNDSKKLSPARREWLYDQIVEQALAWQIAMVGPEQIDKINILQATCQAMRTAVAGLVPQPGLLLIDAVNLPAVTIPVWPIIKGDAQSNSIAAASILAKVTRDRLMDDLDRAYPGYGLATHKGYGTASHYEALLRLGPAPIHRMSFLRNLEEKRSTHPD